MKKHLLFLLVFCLLFSLTGCGKKDSPTQAAPQALAAPAPSVSSAAPALLQEEGRIDHDLTLYKDTMLFAQLYNLLRNIDQYVGQSIKIQGAYGTYFDEEYQTHRHAVVIADAAACCAEAMEFGWALGAPQPNEYLENGDQIEVTGTLANHNANDYTYVRIEASEVKPLTP